jgi:ATP-dependent helicase/nuclease subunit B
MDTLYPLSEDAGVFTHVKRTAVKLIEMSKKLNVKLAKPLYLSGESKYCNFPPKYKRFESEALGSLEVGLFSSEACIYKKTTDDITICSATDISAECAYVAAQVKKLMREKSLRCREIAVIARNPEKYEAPLKSALKKCDIPVFEDKREPITVQPLIRCVCSAIDIASHGFSTDAVFSYLKSGLSVLSDENIAELENYCIMWRIDSGRWLTAWDKNPEGYGASMTSRDMLTLERLNQLEKR